MEIKKIPWDSEIIGKNVIEIVFDKKDMDNLDTSLKCISADAEKYKPYMSVVKLDILNIKAIHSFEDLGFRFIETQFKMSKKITKKLSSLSYGGLEFVKIAKDDSSGMIDEVYDIAKSSFDSDRFYIDPALSKDISGKRYINWIKNSLDNDEYSLLALKSKEKVVSFLLVRNFEGKRYLALGATIPKYKKMGLHVVILSRAINQVIDAGIKSFYGIVSAQNKDATNILIYLGFKIEDAKVVLRKIHTEE